jgi:hypothetical protein
VEDLVHPERALLIGMSRDANVLVTIFIEKSEEEARAKKSGLTLHAALRKAILDWIERAA